MTTSRWSRTGSYALLLALALLVPPSASASDRHAVARETTSFDSQWLFLQSDAADAQDPGFDDTVWRPVNLPHDWSIEGPFAQTNKTGGAGGFLPAGVGWYRKYFTLSSAEANRRVFVQFDGVMANSDVWINGEHLAHRPYGYVSFVYDLTGHLKFGPGETNVIAVRADNSKEPASRWYSGAGIYRHVHLIVTDPIHLEPWSTFVTLKPQDPARPLSENSMLLVDGKTLATPAVISVQMRVSNQRASAGRISVHLSITDPHGKLVATADSASQPVPAGETVECSAQSGVPNPLLWSLDQPNLYQVAVAIRSGTTTLDEETVPFGIRYFSFNPDTGFWLNGKNFKIKGVCLHHDGSAFGAAVPVAVWERRLTALRQLGVNAIRTAHNPPAPEFLDLCDRMGFLVMDEFFDCWTVGKNPFDYHLYFTNWSKIDARDTIRRDRNHPSIILYSVGNEIHDTPKAELAKGILKGLVDVCHEEDPTRPVTQALFRPNQSHDYDNGLADLLDVIGTNYRDNELLAAQQAKPTRKIIGTEQRHDLETWLACRDHPQHSGQFLWTGVDYLGESRRWPIVAAGSGLLDRTGVPRALGYQRASWWSDKPMVFIARRTLAAQVAPTDPGFAPLDRRQTLFSDWTPSNSNPHDENVEVYSNCKEVDLMLNGKSVGTKQLPSDDSPRNWRVPYQPGRLEAIGRNSGRIVARQELRTAGAPVAIVLASDTGKLANEWNDAAYVSATIVDKNGVTVPGATNLVTFTVSGSGLIAAVDSADNSSHEPFQSSQRQAFQGRCFAILRATLPTGKIKLTASSPGLRDDSVKIAAAAPHPE